MTVNIPHLGKITASKEALNTLAVLLLLLEDAEKDPVLANLRNKQRNVIHDALDEKGYYDHLKED